MANITKLLLKYIKIPAKNEIVSKINQVLSHEINNLKMETKHFSFNLSLLYKYNNKNDNIHKNEVREIR